MTSPKFGGNLCVIRRHDVPPSTLPFREAEVASVIVTTYDVSMLKLHGFHLGLCRYAVTNAAVHLDNTAIAKRLQKLDPQLVEYLLLSIADTEQAPAFENLLLNQDELRALAGLFESHEFGRWSWERLDGVHKKGLICTSEISETFSKNVAQQWASDCQSFRSRLEERKLDLDKGIRIVAGWTGEICRLLASAGRLDLIPLPQGKQKTPTIRQAIKQDMSATNQGFAADSRNTPYIEKMRAAIKALGKDASARELLKHAKVNMKSGRQALRFLEGMAEYSGFQKSKADRTQ